MIQTIAQQAVGKAVFAVLGTAGTRKTAFPCIKSIFYNFFFRQYRARLFPGAVAVSRVDHPLDERIPFLPERVEIYLDFVAFWIRTAGFLIKIALVPAAADFIASIGKLYAFAAEVYARNLSTTVRPRYLKSVRFVLIHAFDPHLMCIPSLHVMVVIGVYTRFAALVRPAGDTFSSQRSELKTGALAITEAVLYVKQHSVNCISAALYAMTRFDAALFPPEEAADFVSRLFVDGTLNAEDAALIREHILALYRRFLTEGSASWEEPLLTFLAGLRP